MRTRPGFTLFEVLVAGALAAAMFAVLLVSLRDSRVSFASAAGTEAALAVARNHLALLSPNIADAAPSQSGRDGAYAWRLHIVREEVASPGSGIVAAYLARKSARPALFGVNVEVRWRSGGRERVVQLATHRVGSLPPSGEFP